MYTCCFRQDLVERQFRVSHIAENSQSVLLHTLNQHCSVQNSQFEPVELAETANEELREGLKKWLVHPAVSG